MQLRDISSKIIDRIIDLRKKYVAEIESRNVKPMRPNESPRTLQDSSSVSVEKKTSVILIVAGPKTPIPEYVRRNKNVTIIWKKEVATKLFNFLKERLIKYYVDQANEE